MLSWQWLFSADEKPAVVTSQSASMLPKAGNQVDKEFVNILFCSHNEENVIEVAWLECLPAFSVKNCDISNELQDGIEDARGNFALALRYPVPSNCF